MEAIDRTARLRAVAGRIGPFRLHRKVGMRQTYWSTAPRWSECLPNRQLCSCLRSGMRSTSASARLERVATASGPAWRHTPNGRHDGSRFEGRKSRWRRSSQRRRKRLKKLERNRRRPVRQITAPNGRKSTRAKCSWQPRHFDPGMINQRRPACGRMDIKVRSGKVATSRPC